jgi:N-acetylmuramoyl-L-alanine amidase
VRIEASARIPAYGTPRRVDDTHLEWTLYHTQAGPEADRTEPQGPVQAYAVEEQGAHVTLRLTLIEGRRVEAVAYRDRASSDLLLNLAYADARPSDRARALPQPAAEASGAEETETASEKTTADADASGSAASASEASASEASPKPTAAPETASAGSTDALASARERWRLNTIVIDAGHGGKDPGAQAYGVDEKDIVLDVALKLGEYIENRLGINVVYTRKTDKFIPLEERGRIANQAKAKLFISLHANASRSRSAHGTETFFLGRSKTEAARKVMKRENSVVRFEDNPEQYEAYDEKALVRYTLTQSTYMQNSEYLAGLIQEQFVERAGRDGRGVHQAGFYVLWSASMPAVLVELGFLTNRQENREMRTERVKDYLASAIFRAIRDYRPHYEKGISAPTAQGK